MQNQNSTVRPTSESLPIGNAVLAEVPARLNDLAQVIHQNAKDKGFFEKEKNIGEMLCLIHSEVSEALEADRKNNYCQKKSIDYMNQCEWSLSHFRDNIKNTFEDELADVIIRVLDLCAYKGIDIEKHILMKMRYNLKREKYHGKKY